MSRAMTTTAITIAPFLNIPVKQFAAVENHDPQFHKFHLHEDGSASRMRMPMVCLACEAEVPRSDLASGVERGDESIIVTKEELAELEVDAGKEFDVAQFVHEDSINPLRLEVPYHLVPAASTGSKKVSKSTLEAYSLLRDMLAESRKVGIVLYTQRSKTHLAVLRAMGAVLVLHHVRWSDEVRSPDFAELRQHVEVAPKAKKLFGQIMESMTVDSFNDDQFVDEYAELVTQLIESKESGVPMVHPDRGEVPEDVTDLVAALEKQVAAREAKRPAVRKSPRKSA